jgi:hypothetical protein
MIGIKQPKKILLSISASPALPWRDDIEKIRESNLDECALFLDKLGIDERRELYKALETLNSLVIPFVRLAADMEIWEFDFLTTKFQARIFSCPAEPKFLALTASFQKYKPLIALENPLRDSHKALFTDEALTRNEYSNICLNLAVLERDRRRNKKKYDTSIHTLDHHTLVATQLSPLPSAWFRRILAFHSRRLTTLSDLQYLRHIPAPQLAATLIIASENTLDEQLEIKEYIRLLVENI